MLAIPGYSLFFINVSGLPALFISPSTDMSLDSCCHMVEREISGTTHLLVFEQRLGFTFLDRTRRHRPKCKSLDTIRAAHGSQWRAL